MDTYKKNWLKFTLSFLICLFIRLIPIRPPNIEPILATQMPLSKAYGAYAGFFFAFLSIVLYDLLTDTLGIWTLITASAYGLLGFSAFFYFKKHKADAWGYARFAIFGTLFFDGITGLSIGPIFFQQSFMSALVGQIPFTLWHLVGNVSFSFILSPVIYDFVINNKKLENFSLLHIFNPRKI